MKSRFRVLAVLGALLLSVFASWSALADGFQPVWPGGPTLQEVRSYSVGNTATVTITLSGFTRFNLVRVHKVADQPGWYAGSTRSRFETDMAVYADGAGQVYLTDTSVVPSGQYTYTFVDSSGLLAIVPVQIAQEWITVPYRVQCVAFASSRLFIGAEGVALQSQFGYTRATVDPLYSDQTNIGLSKGDHFVVINGPVCDGRSVWWQVFTVKNTMEYDQMMYIRENQMEQYLVQPTDVRADVSFQRYLPGTGRYWTPVTDRFRINVRSLPTWCQQDHQDIAPVIYRARAGELFPVTAITSDSRWVQIVLPDGQLGWVGTHFGNVNFYVPYVAYGNTEGVFVFPPTAFDPAGVPPWQLCGE